MIDAKILKNAERIIFVCSGNIIRSAFSELYAKTIYNYAIFDSIGVTYHNTSIHQRAADKLWQLGCDPELIEQFQPKHITDFLHTVSNEKLNKSIFFSMTTDHMIELYLYQIPQQSCFLLTNLVEEDSNISDPYFSGDYKGSFEKIIECINQLVKVLKEE